PSQPASSSSSSRLRSPCPVQRSSRGRDCAGSRGHASTMVASGSSDVVAVTVTLNGLPWIEQCLDSLRGVETIVVDHGSTDGTLELVRGLFADVRVIEQENKGYGAGVNAGMRATAGRYYLIINPDAWVLGH